MNRTKTKHCPHCGHWLPRGRFHRKTASSDGLQHWCKSCMKRERDLARVGAVEGDVCRGCGGAAKVGRYRFLWGTGIGTGPACEPCIDWCDAERARRRRETSNAARTRHRARYPYREKARLAVTNAVQRGHISPGPCEVCRATPTEGHHESYAERHQLHVVWLCRDCHRAHHAGRIKAPLHPAIAAERAARYRPVPAKGVAS